MGKIVNFHLPADDVDRASKFYREVFGWEFTQVTPSPVPYLVYRGDENGAGIPAAIIARAEIVKAPTPTIEVSHVDQAMLDIAMKGGQQGLVHDIPGVGRFGYAIDSEGNVIALLQRSETPA